MESLKCKLDIDFLKNIIEKELSKHSFSFENKAGKGKIKDIEIEISVNEKGDFDLSEQQRISEIYKK